MKMRHFLLLAVLATASAQRSNTVVSREGGVTRTTTTTTEEQPIQGGLQTIRLLPGQQRTQTISLQGLQGIQGLGGLQTIDASQLQGLNLGGNTQVRTITLEELQRLGLTGVGGGGGQIRIIQIPGQTQAVNTGAQVLTLQGGGGGLTRTTTTTITEEEEARRAALAAAPAPIPIPIAAPAPVARTRITTRVDSNSLDEAANPAPEPYSFSYSSDTEDGSRVTREESQDANGVVTGFYTIQDADGRDRRVDYVADENGYRATVRTNEMGTETSQPADVDMQSSQPSASQLSQEWTQQNGGQQQQQVGGQQRQQGFASQRTVQTSRSSSSTTQQRNSRNFEVISPASLGSASAAAPTQARFVLVQVPQQQPVQQQAAATPIAQFVQQRQATAASTTRNRFAEFGARMSSFRDDIKN